MSHSPKQTDPMPQSDDTTSIMQRSFSWDKAFFTCDGILNEEELSSMIEGGGNDVNHQLPKIEEIDSLEDKLFEEIEASNKKSSGTSNLTNSTIRDSSGKKDPQSKKVTGAAGPYRAALITLSPSLGPSTPIKTQPTRSSATLARSSTTSRTGKATAVSHSKTPPGISTKNKMLQAVNTHLPRTSPSSPVSPGSSGSTSSSTSAAVNRNSSRSSGVPCRSSVNNGKSSSVTNPRKKDNQKVGKPIPYIISSIISMKNKPPPLSSHPSSPLGRSESSSTTFTANQRSISSASRGTSVAKSAAALRSQTGTISRPSSEGKSNISPLLDDLPKTGQHSKPGSPNSSKVRKHPSPKTIAADRELKLNSHKTTSSRSSNKQSSSSGSKGAQNILSISPEILDIKGKLNALKMEISLQKKERSKSGKGESSSTVGVIQKNNQTKST